MRIYEGAAFPGPGMSETPRPLLSPDFIAAAIRAQAEFGLCDHCLGRLVAKIETGLTNDKRGRILRQAAGLPEIAASACATCEQLFDEVEDFARLALKALAEFEFATYLVGTRVDEDVLDRERETWETLNLASGAEPINTELNREIGRRVGDATGKAVDFRDPHVTVVVDTRFNVTEVSHGGLFLFARYRKFDRTLPQTVWPCRRCRGRGCTECGGLGKRYEASVQELVEHVPKAWTGATETAFHGAGREDVDARALGTGRPFVLEFKDPRRRTLDLPALEAAINDHARPRVEVEGLRIAKKSEVVRVKDFRGTKTYRAEVEFGAPPEEANLFKGVEALRGRAIAQRTPSRVEHRRADKVRDRRVLEIDVEEFAGARGVLRIRGDAGLYIKELVSGDEGRTTPSLAELVGVAARVTALDVIAVEYDDEGAAPHP